MSPSHLLVNQRSPFYFSGISRGCRQDTFVCPHLQWVESGLRYRRWHFQGWTSSHVPDSMPQDQGLLICDNASHHMLKKLPCLTIQELLWHSSSWTTQVGTKVSSQLHIPHSHSHTRVPNPSDPRFPIAHSHMFQSLKPTWPQISHSPFSDVSILKTI